MTFKEYLATRRITDTPQGDFTGDARRDKNMPDVKSWDELKAYLQMKVGRSEVIEAARLVWQGYLAKQRNLTESN